MRVLTIVGVALVGGVAAVSAQHSHQLEIGGFGTYTRFDPVWGLKWQAGGGGRLGFFLNEYFGLEVDASMASPVDTTGTAGTAIARGSASLVLNSGGEHNVLYVLGGYTRSRWGGGTPYLWRNDVHGGIGDRIFFGRHVALRLEGRAFYSLDDLSPGKKPLDFTGSAGLSFFLGGGGGGGEQPAPEIPKATRDSILAAGGTLPSTGHGHQLEIGGFGTYTRYDPVWGLKWQPGGGARLGFFLNKYLGLEVDANMASPVDTTGTAGTAIARGSASLVINSGGESNVLFVLGGYTRSRWGGGTPYLWRNDVHGGIGDRIFFGRHVALRLEGRAFYSLDDLSPGKKPLDFTGSAGLSLLVGGGGGRRPPAPAPAPVPEIPKEKRDSILAAGGTPPPPPPPQPPPPPHPAPPAQPEPRPAKQVFLRSATSWPHQWFWGGQAGVLIFKTSYDGLSAEPTFGGHWMITGKKTALYVAYEQSFFLTDRHATVAEPNGTIEPGNVAFRSVRRIIGGVLAYPVQKAIQPYGGGGFAIVEILNPTVTCTGCSVSDFAITQNAADFLATKAFFFWMGGLEARQGRLTLYGHYILTSSSRTFLLDGVTHTLQGGLRYSFGSAREDISDQH